jgi:hypothetical protein
MATKSLTKNASLTGGIYTNMALTSSLLQLTLSGAVTYGSADLIPPMTSNTSQSGYSPSWSGSSSASAYKFFDNDYSSLLNFLSPQGNVTIALPTAKKLGKYSLTVSGATNAPSAWEVRGYTASNSWVTVHSGSKSDWTTGSTVQFTVSSPQLCTQYQLVVTSTQGGGNFYLREWDLFELVESYNTSGFYESPIIDLSESIYSLDTLTYSHTLNSGIVTYSTATSDDGITFDAYQTIVAGGVINSPKRRYIRVKASVTVSDASKTPTISSITVNYKTGDKYLFQDGGDIKKYQASYTSDITPPMTSNTLPSPYVASADYDGGGYFSPWKVFNNTTVDSLDSWLGGTSTGWLQLDFGTGGEKAIAQYAITFANRTEVGRAPKSWTFEGSNTGLFSGEQVILDTRIAETAWAQNQKRTYAFSNSVTYRFYRLNITANNGDAQVMVGELEMMEANPPWAIVGTAPATKAMFDTDGMTDLSLITNAAIQGLVSATPEVLCWTDEVATAPATVSRTANLTAVPLPQLLLPIGDITVGELESVVLNNILSGSGDLKVIVSPDSGTSWKGKTSVDPADLTNVKANGFTPTEFNALTKEELASLFPSGTARFAFYLEQEASTEVVQVNSLTVNERQYTMTPSVDSLSVLYELLQSEKPALYVSRDDGVTWKQVQPDQLTKLDDLPAGSKLRVKAVLSNGQELHGLSYSWI